MLSCNNYLSIHKKDIMKKIIIIIIAIVLLSPALAGLTLRKVIGINNQNESRVDYIYQQHDYQRDFTSPKDRLISLSFKMKNSSNQNADPFSFILYQNGNEIRRLDISGGNIKDSEWTRFVFEEIPKSKDQSYTFVLRSTTQSKYDALAIYVTDQLDPTLITNHRVSSRLRVIEDIYLGLFQHLLLDLKFALIWSALIVFCICLLPILDRNR